MKKSYVKKSVTYLVLLLFIVGISNHKANAWRLFGKQLSEGITTAYVDGTVCYTETTYFFGIAVKSDPVCGACC